MSRRPPLRTTLALAALGSATAVAALLASGDGPTTVVLGVASRPLVVPNGVFASSVPFPGPAATPLPVPTAAPSVSPLEAASRDRVPARTAPAPTRSATPARRPRTTTTPAPASTATAPQPRRTTAAPRPAPTTAPPATRAPATSGSAYTSRLLALVNAARADRGLRRLTLSSCAQGYAQRQAASMARRGVMDHQDLNAVLNGCDASSVGENVAYGNSTADEMFTDWMNSSGHRANILSARWTHMGNGATTRSDGRVYGSQVFLDLS